LLAVKNDEELSNFFANAMISQGGVLPHINPALLPKKKRH
jgi:histone H2A